MRVQKYIIFIGIIGISLSLQAVQPRKWELRTREDFLKGRLDGVSLSSDGLLALAPKVEKIDGPTEDFFLSLHSGPGGSVYLGTGHGGKIFRLEADGKATLFFQAPEMDVSVLTMDSKGTLFAGTSPNGKVYKITGKDQSEVFFNPGEKYIWDMAFADDGSLLVAVGESAGVYKVNAQGEGQLILKPAENHILCLVRDGKGGFLAGSGGVGVVYKLGSDGRSTLLFESSFEEIKSLAIDSSGEIYAAAGGSPSKARKEETAETPVRLSTEITVAVLPAPETAQAKATPIPAGIPLAASPKEPSALYKIRSDGTAKKVWESADELIYALLWQEAEKRLLFGTGNRGRIYMLDQEDKAALLLQENSEQVYALVSIEKKIYTLANNPARLSFITSEQRLNGEYISDILDARIVASWGKLEFDADLPSGAILQIQTRSGNAFEPNSTWSEWSPPIQKKEEQILSPRARYLQWRALFKSQAGNASPLLRRVALSYLQANSAPIIRKLELLPPNEVFIKPPEQEEVIWGAEELIASEADKKKEDRLFLTPKKAERKGYQTVIWEAADENEDRLAYKISLRREDESTWRVIREGWKESLFVFDTLSFPDGTYFLKLEASDLPSNPPGTELRAEKLSPAFVVDNSPPTVKNFTVARDKNALDISLQVEDSGSAIESLEYLIRPAEWRVVFPVDGICDSKAEDFKFRAVIPAGADNLVTVRVTDRHHNIGVFRQAF